MNKARADEIIRNTFYSNLDSLSLSLQRRCEDSKVAFDVGRYVGMMQKNLENELEKEVEVSNNAENI